MTSVTREALKLMKYYNPYSDSDNADEVTYDEIYHAVQVLSRLRIIKEEEFIKMYELDRKLFNDYINEK